MNFLNDLLQDFKTAFARMTPMTWLWLGVACVVALALQALVGLDSILVGLLVGAPVGIWRGYVDSGR